MAADLTTLNAILKDDYKSLTENLNNKAFMLAQVKKSSGTIRGRRATHSVHLGRSGAIGATIEGAATPTADQQRYNTVQVPCRYQNGRIQLSVQVIKQANGDVGSFIDALEGEMNITNDLMRDVNRQIYGTSNGVIVQYNITTTSATIVLASATRADFANYLYVGRKVDIGTVASPFTIAQNRTITAVSVANKTITISGATVSTTAAHFVFQTAAGGASTNTGLPVDGQVELTGLQTMVSTTAILHTIDPATNPTWQANVYGNSGTLRPLGETTIDRALMDTTAASGATPDILVSGAGVFVAGKSILTGYQRNMDMLELKGGFRGIKWSTPGIAGTAGRDVAWYGDFDCTPNFLYGVNSDSLVYHQVEEGWQWMDEDGAILSRVPNSLAYEAVVYSFAELACKQRNANFLISDLIEAS